MCVVGIKQTLYKSLYKRLKALLLLTDEASGSIGRLKTHCSERATGVFCPHTTRVSRHNIINSMSYIYEE